MSDDTITLLPVEQLHESSFNPRRTFAGIDDLAASIKNEGRIHQPLLVRPRVYAQGLARRTDGLREEGDEQDGYEVVFGHRRLRAAEAAGLGHVPCMVRAMTDNEARRAQIAENLQRQDVHPIEEAEGFQSLMDQHGVSADELAAQVGKSRSYVYGRLKLLQACPAVRMQCLDGKVGAEVALLIARLRTDKLQAKALQYIQAHNLSVHDGGTKSFRRIRDLLREKFTLHLQEALFDPDDDALLPDAGACSTCPKRSGMAPEYDDLVQDTPTPYGRVDKGSANLCTDPDCFAAKKAAHLKVKAAELQAKGKTVLDGNKARAAIDAQGHVKGGYIALKNVKDQLAKARRAAQANSKVVPPQVVTIQDPRTGYTVEAVKVEELKAAGVKVAEPEARQRADHAEKQRRWEEQRAREREQQQKAMAERLQLLDRARTASDSRELDAADLAMVVQVALAGVKWRDRTILVGLWGFSSFEALQEKSAAFDARQLTRLLLDVALTHDISDMHDNEQPAAMLMAAAKRWSVDQTPPADVQASELVADPA